MAKDTIKMRIKDKSGELEVKSLITHPMETGMRKDKKTGELVPAHFIQEITAELNGKPVMTAYWGGAISKNPYLSFKIKGGKTGDQIRLSWKDNTGDSDSLTTALA